MMISTRKLALGSAMLFAIATSGCIVVNGRGSFWGIGPAVWTEIETQQLAIDPSGLKSLEVRTHNGDIDFSGQPAGAAQASLIATKKAGGITATDAEAAMEAIVVFVEPTGDGTQRIGWRWRGVKRLTWRAEVSFAITAPGQLRVGANTHNGGVAVTGVSGDVNVVTHNGRVKVGSRTGRLSVVTHNGDISAEYAGGDLSLITHNGEITADLQACATVRGDITTHNGSVTVAAGNETSAVVTCNTHNGSIKLDSSIEKTRSSRHHVEARLGNGGDSLAVSTHNGSIVVKKSAG